MNITFISDTHQKHVFLDKYRMKGDILCHSGDFTNHGKYEYVEDFLKWFDKQDFEYKVFIAGNHELGFENKSSEIKSLLDKYVSDKFIYLEDSGVNIEGINIYGTPYTPKFMHWEFMRLDDDELKLIYDKIPQDTDILLSHGPIWLVGDYYNGINLGSIELYLKFLYESIKPKIMSFGHIHSGYGMYQKFNTLFVNSSISRDNSDYINSPVDINYNSLKDYVLE